MDKAKQATTGFAKQIDDIKKKFSTSFKDIFLGFFAPMVLLNSAISSISGAIEDARRRAQEGLDLLAKGDSMFVSAHERRMAAYFKERQERDKESEAAREGRAEATRMFLETSPEGQELLNKLRRENLANFLINPRFTANMANREDVQKRALGVFSETEQGKAALRWEETQRKQKEAADRARKEEEDAKVKAAKDSVKKETASTLPGSMSGNVIGVGANPVVTALQEQQAIARASLTQLEIIAAQFGYAATYKDVTASGATPSTPANASPSRAALLTKNK
jgi:hypothetical protein